ncbi:DUF4055 domain-containing protein [Bradyrhizobium sp. URHD0069]|uniref:DUF4055 domain-containing protein n=1 Tax=Bradyrhizobium sp. URHD0069 TaxID=1380355 RepID=UPI00068C9615|nr:DUF4055 domain-containing protein [Bradyrhizobium sp. URHD0069]
MADEIDPSATSSDYDAQIAFWEKVDAILQGEDAIKAGTTTYLPKFANEKQAVYDYRLANAPFTNIYSDISKNLASKPFSKELVLKEGTPPPFVKLAENIDGQGNNLHVFAASAFKSALDKGIDWILIDYTKAKPRADGRPLSRAEEAQQKLRPYWVHVPAENMRAVYSDFVGGVEVIHRACISETSKQIDGFEETCIERVRVLDRVRLVDELGQTTGYAPATWTLWEHQTNSEGKAGWVIIGSGPITIGIIPLVAVTLTKRSGGSWIVEPAIRDIANMQITEYRQESNLNWVSIMTCFPMFCISGMETKDATGALIEVSVGPNMVFQIPQNQQGTGPAGTATVVETSGAATSELREQLELFRKEMRDLGMQPLAEANLTVVTTANVSKKASSAVQAWAFLFKDALESALKITAMWLGDKVEPEVVLHTDFAVELESGKELDALLKSQGQGIYSAETVRAEFKRRNVVSNDLTEEEEQQRLAEEQEGQQLQPEKVIDPVTGAPVVVTPEHGTVNPPPAPVKPRPTAN